MVANFTNAVCRDAPAPALQASPPRRRSRQQEQVFSIWSSEGLAQKSRHQATKPAVQAQNVMMKKLGVTSETHPSDATSFQQYTDTFSSALTAPHCEALYALLPAGMGYVRSEVAASVQVF